MPRARTLACVVEMVSLVAGSLRTHLLFSQDGTRSRPITSGSQSTSVEQSKVSVCRLISAQAVLLSVISGVS